MLMTLTDTWIGAVSITITMNLRLDQFFDNNYEIIDYIKHIDERFDKQKVIDFKYRFMCSCDGHSTERILKIIFGDELEWRKRPNSLGEENQLHYVSYEM